MYNFTNTKPDLGNGKTTLQKTNSFGIKTDPKPTPISNSLSSKANPTKIEIA